MWREKLLILLSSLSKKQLTSVALFLAGFALLSSGLIFSLNTSNSKNDITFEPSSNSTQSPIAESKESTGITVDVEGAVITPGVYSLNSSARVKDALISAGGLSSGADRNWIAKNLNLALKLTDSMKIYIPFAGESSVQTANSSTGNISTNGLININSASLAELDTLPGIGPVTAQKIVDGRPYTSINDLLNKKIVKTSVYENIKGQIIVY